MVAARAMTDRGQAASDGQVDIGSYSFASSTVTAQAEYGIGSASVLSERRRSTDREKYLDRGRAGADRLRVPDLCACVLSVSIRKFPSRYNFCASPVHASGFVCPAGGERGGVETRSEERWRDFGKLDCDGAAVRHVKRCPATIDGYGESAQGPGGRHGDGTYTAAF